MRSLAGDDGSIILYMVEATPPSAGLEVVTAVWKRVARRQQKRDQK